MLVTRHHRPNALDAWWFRCSEKISILASRLQESRYQALRDQIISLAVRYAIPVSYPGRGYVDAGGLISYGTEFVDVYHRCAAYVVRILRGEAPQNLLPSEYATFSDGCTICQTPVTRVGLKSADQALRAPYARPLSSLEKSYSIAREMPAVPWSFAAAESSARSNPRGTSATLCAARVQREGASLIAKPIWHSL